MANIHTPAGAANPYTAWPQEHRDIIAQRLLEGDTAAKIGALFGKSKNAIIGIVQRDGSLRAIGFKHGSNGGGLRKGQKRTPRAKTVPVGPVQGAPLPEPLSERHVAGLPMAALASQQCRFPVNDAEKGEIHLFCGSPSKGPWCEYHRSLVYQPRSSLNERAA